MEKHLVCPICQDVLTGPVETDCCSTVFCRGCLEDWSNRSSATVGSPNVFFATSPPEHQQQRRLVSCPACRQPLTGWTRNRPIEHMVQELPADCPFKSNGCLAAVTRGTLQLHSEKCEFSLVSCPNSAECERVMRKDLNTHLETCPHRPVECDLCKEKIGPSVLEHHKANDCQYAVISCCDCGENVERRNMEQHSQRCHRRIATCPFAPWGCKAEPFMAPELQQHLSQDSAMHLIFALSAITTLSSRVAVLETESQALRARLGPIALAGGDLAALSPTPTPPPSNTMGASGNDTTLLQDNQAGKSSPSLKRRDFPSKCADETEFAKKVSDPTPSAPVPIKQHLKSPIDQLQQQVPSPATTPTPTKIHPDDDDDIAKEKRALKQKQQFGGAEVASSPGSEMQQTMSIESGIKMLMQLPPKEQPKYSRLISRPYLIAENLMMDARVEELGNLVECMDSMRSDPLLSNYAMSAMHFENQNFEQAIGNAEVTWDPSSSVAAATNPTPNTTTQAPHLDWHLTGDTALDEQVRSQHYFPSAPDSALAIKLLALCRDQSKAAYAALTIFENFSGFVTGFVQFEENLRLVLALKDILNYAKLVLFKNPAEVQSGTIELCDTFIAHVELLERIVRLRCPLQVQMQDLADSNRARHIRDKLTDMGQFELSRDLSLRCQLTLDTVWVSWGLQCLRDRKYPDAREMFRKALAGSSASGSGGASPYSSPSSRARSPSVGASSNPQSGGTPLTSPSKMMSGNLRRASSLIARTIDPQRIVEQIISTLAQSVAIVAPPPSPSPPPAAPNNEPVTPSSGEAVAKLGPDVLRECIYYLENYGTRRSLISFYIKYDMLESAIKACLAYNVDPDVFVDEVVRPCMSNSSLQDVKTIIKKIDPSLSSARSFLFASCKYFSEKKAYKTLVMFQIFMGDYARAALTCIKVFIDTQDQHYRLKSLEVAKDYFTEAIRLASKTPGDATGNSVLTIPEMERYLEKIRLQSEVLHVILPKLEQDPVLQYVSTQHPGFGLFTLFGPPQHKSALTWALLVLQPSTGAQLLALLMRHAEWTTLLHQAAAYVGRSFAIPQVTEWIKNITAELPTEWSDAVMMPVVEIFAKEKKDVVTAEKLAGLLVSPAQRVDALILCGKLKSAYLAAVKMANKDLVRKIFTEAALANEKNIVKLCAKYLEIGDPTAPTDK